MHHCMNVNLFIGAVQYVYLASQLEIAVELLILYPVPNNVLGVCLWLHMYNI